VASNSEWARSRGHVDQHVTDRLILPSGLIPQAVPKSFGGSLRDSLNLWVEGRPLYAEPKPQLFHPRLSSSFEVSPFTIHVDYFRVARH
jgi:hypothetical protein